MGGIAGEIAFHGKTADLSTVCRVSEAMVRTPYGYGTCSWGWVALGHHRHGVVRGPRAVAQPLVDDRLRLGIVLTGTIVNRDALREELTGHYPFRDHSDSETSLAAYHRWGEHFVERLDGAFALAVVDAFRERVLLARDADGAIPLYLGRRPGLVRFASAHEPLRVDGLHAAGNVVEFPPATTQVFDRSGRSIRRPFGEDALEAVDA